MQWLGSVGSVGHLRDSFTLYGMQKEDSQWRFAPKKALELESGVVAASKVVHCHSHGMPAPFLLVEHQPRSDTKRFELLRYVAVDGGCFVKHTQFEFAKSRLPNDIDFCILNGPCVMWSEGTNIHLACTGARGLSHMTLHSLNVQENFREKMKIDKFWAFDWNQNEHEASAVSLLFIRVQSCSAGEENRGPMETGLENVSPDWLLLFITMQEPDLQVERLSDSSLVPRDYGCIATCITQHWCYHVGSCGEVVSKCQFIVGTFYQQVIVFNEGTPLHCVSLQYVPEKVMSVETMDDEIAIAVQCSAGEAYAFKITDSGPLECESWQGVSDLLAGDFAGIGHDQLLVIFSGNGKLSKFCVTDLVQFTADSESERVRSGTAAQLCATESLVSAVKALQIRKQTGEAYLTDMRREVQQKSQLLESSLSLVKSLEGLDTTTPTLPTPDPALICLLPGNIDVNGQTTSCPVASRYRPSCGLKLVHSWQRIVDGLWIIGIVAQNQTQNLLCDMGFSLVSGSSRLPQECSSSRILWTEQDSPKESEQAGPPAPKKQKCDYAPTSAVSFKGGVVLPGRKFCCVLKTTLPVLASHTLEVSLVSSWRTAGHEDPPRPNNGGHLGCELARLGAITLAVEDFGSCSLSCSGKCLSLWNGEETWSEKECGMEGKDQQDLACLLAARSFIKLEAHSTFTNLLRLPAMLKVRLPLPDHAVYTAGAVLPHGGSGMVSCAGSPSGALEGVVLYITPHVHSAQVSILYKTAPQLVLLIEMMQSALPEDVLLSASPGNSPQVEVLATCLRCVRQELNSKSEVVEQRLQELKRGDGERVEGGGSVESGGSGGGSHTRLESQTNTAITTLMHKFT